MTHSRLEPKVRKQAILAAAVEVAQELGFSELTRSAVAAKADVADGTVSKYFNTMAQLRRAVARHAMRTDNPVILAMMVADKNYKPMLSEAHVSLAVQHLTSG